MQYILLFLTSILAGALNSVAGGGSFFTFPMLIFTGMSSIVANATNTMAIWPGSIASVVAYKEEVIASRKLLPMLMATSMAGSGLGAFVLLKTPETVFSGLIPYLLLFATLLFAFSGHITRQFRKLRGMHLGTAGSVALQLAIAFYGGYFGGGMGIMMLAMLSLIGLTDIHQMNGLKTVLGTMINGIAVVIFVISGIIAWPQASVMIAGAIIGGYAGAAYAKKLPASVVRKFVIATGAAMTVYFFLR